MVLDDIKVGTIFIGEQGKLYIKTDLKKDGFYTCVNLNNGIVMHYNSSFKVKVVPIKLDEDKEN